MQFVIILKLHLWSKENTIKKLSLLFIFIGAFSCVARAQADYIINTARSEIRVDGVLDEDDWLNAAAIDNFWQQFPADSSKAETKTEVKILKNDAGIFIAAKCFDELEGDNIIQSLRRDFSDNSNDAFIVVIDPFEDLVNGFYFALSPRGVQAEGLLPNGGGDPDLFWDNLWYSEVKKFDGYWTVEMAIPFTTLRYKSGKADWRFNFARTDYKRNEISVWAPVPRNFGISSLAFTKKAHFENAPVRKGLNASLIPSLITSRSEDYQNREIQNGLTASMDAKIPVSSSLNLDLTVNPDFSQVEVDRQVTNLTRFSVFFPERRTFFLENSDLFERFGFRQIRPFFSRRIGLSQGSTLPILAGARLSGKLNEKWRIGAMSMQTEGKSDLGLAANNYTVGAFQRQIFGRSNIAGILVNRQGFLGNSPDWSDYNRIVGLDYDIYSKNNAWRGKVFYHRSFSPGVEEKRDANASWILYRTRKWFVMWNHEYVGENYRAETGFVRRNTLYDPGRDTTVGYTYWRLEPKVGYTMYPENGIVNSHGPSVYLDHYMDSTFKTTDYLIRTAYEISFQNTSYLRLSHEEKFTLLQFDADITFVGNDELAAGGYNYRDFGVSWNSDRRRLLNLSVEVDAGQYYLGTRFRTGLFFSYRAQPWGVFTIQYNRNELRNANGFQSAYLDLFGGRIDLTFTKKLFFTTFVQYNTQGNILTSNIRFQWRFKPMSDLFIVYSDNYDPFLNVQNRALVLKLIYWLNV